jgi:putative aldouronate transport system permease protein
MVLPGFIVLLVFSDIPMYGIVMAFQSFRPALGFFKSPFANPWYRYFRQLVTDVYFARLLKNTLTLGILSLLWAFPAPIVFALLLNEVKGRMFKRISQTISYMPYFLSSVIVVGIMKLLLATDGPIGVLLSRGDLQMQNPFLFPGAFRTLYIVSGIWSGVGFSSIIYLAAIAGINPELYEAAKVDGANRFQQIVHITLPCIAPTIIILFIFAVSGIVGNDWQKILLIYNEATYSTADVIGTYVYRIGITQTSYSYAAAVGLFTNVVSFLLLVITNYIARRIGETSLW